MTIIACLCRLRAALLIGLVVGATLFALSAVRSHAQSAGPVIKPILHLGSEGDFAPYNYLDENGDLVGFDIDLGNEICARANFACIWVRNDWETIIDGLLAHRYDAILAGMSNTAERRQYVAFSTGYDNGNAAGVYVGRDTFFDPASATIAVQSNTVHEAHLRAKGYTVQSHPTAAAAIEAVLTGTADLLFGSPSYIDEKLYSVRQHSGQSLVVVWEETIDAGPASIAFRKEDTGLRGIFDEILEQMRVDNSLQQLRLKWFGAKIET